MSEKRILLPNGDLLIRSDEGIYFMAVGEDGMPLPIDQEKGELELFDAAINYQMKAAMYYHDRMNSIAVLTDFLNDNKLGLPSGYETDIATDIAMKTIKDLQRENDQMRGQIEVMQQCWKPIEE